MFEDKFRNASNRFYTQDIFYEMVLADKSTVLYTLKDRDHMGYPSLYRLYMEMEDSTEYEFSNTHLGGWSHWQQLCECPFFKKYVTRWREELSLLHTSRAIKQIKSVAADPNSRNHVMANKLLLDLEKVKSSVGRPTKEKIQQEARKLADNEADILRDFGRIN